MNNNYGNNLHVELGSGVGEKHEHFQGSESLGFRGIPGCTYCGGSGFTSSTNEFGFHKICSSCAEMSDLFLPRCRGVPNCKHCSGDGFVKSGYRQVKPCHHCLRLTDYCKYCLNTKYILGSGIPCNHNTQS